MPEVEVMSHIVKKCKEPSDPRFGSFACDVFRPDITLDASGTLPYYSGANIVLFADHVYDFHVRRILNGVRNGDVVYVKTDLITEFFNKIYPRISQKFILITHNSDFDTKIAHKVYLHNNSKLIAWLGPNIGFEHPKHIVLPLGFENPTWFPPKIGIVRSINETSLIPWEKRKYLLYINFNPSTNNAARKEWFERFEDNEEVLVSQTRVNFAEYLNHMGNSKFVLCPRGNGRDTHRFSESILMGSVPVVEDSILSPVFRESQALILKNLFTLTLDMLKKTHVDAKRIALSKKVIMWQTWKDRINALRPK
jgi:hypothetical protein